MNDSLNGCQSRTVTEPQREINVNRLARGTPNTHFVRIGEPLPSDNGSTFEASSKDIRRSFFFCAPFLFRKKEKSEILRPRAVALCRTRRCDILAAARSRRGSDSPKGLSFTTASPLRYPLNAGEKSKIPPLKKEGLSDYFFDARNALIFSTSSSGSVP